MSVHRGRPTHSSQGHSSAAARPRRSPSPRGWRWRAGPAGSSGQSPAWAGPWKGIAMGTSTQPAANVHPGAVQAIFDHLLLSLTADGEPGPPVFAFSHYRFRWAASGTAGELAFVEVDRGRGMERLVLTDAVALAAEQAGRLSPRSWEPHDVERPPIVATFGSTSLAGTT